MQGNTFASIWSSLEPEARVAFLQKEAKRQNAILAKDAARYIAQSFASNAGALEVALIRLIAYSSFTGSPLTLEFTERTLEICVDVQGPKGTVDPFHRISVEACSPPSGTNPRQKPVAADSSLTFSVMKTGEARKITRVRQQFEVNMREHEREGLARLDVHERALEIRVKKRKRG